MSEETPRFSVNGHGKQPDNESRQISRALHERFEALNKLWQSAEAQLKEFPVPFDVVVIVNSLHEQHTGEPYYELLGYANEKGGWRICHAWADWRYDSPEQVEAVKWTPIAESPAEVRRQMIKHFPKLRDTVKDKARAYVGELDTAIDQFKMIL